MDPFAALKFPCQAEQLALEGRRLQQFSFEQRLARTIGLMNSGRKLLTNAPRRVAQIAERDRIEAQARAKWIDLFSQQNVR